MRVYILALNGVFDSGLATVLDAFNTANELAEMSGKKSVRFDVSIVGVRKNVKTYLGLSVPVVPVGNKIPDCVVLPAIGYKMPDALEKALGTSEVKEATDLLKYWSSKGALMTAACIGTFIMAEAGLLDNQTSTTTWWLAPFFRKRYPKVNLDESKMLIKSGNIVTAGAALSHMDLALWLIRKISPELSALTAKYLIVDSRPTQAAYILSDHLIYSDPTVEKFEKWVRLNLKKGFSLDDAAKATGTSKRTLARKIQEVLGKTPLSFFQDLRVEHAVHLLKTTDFSVEEIAEKVGYENGVTLRTLLRDKTGRGIKEIRG